MSLVLIRGLPGSGKSTMASILYAAGFCHFEADDYFETPAGYWFDKTKLSDAHRECYQNTVHALKYGKNCVVANTFVRLREMAPYLIQAKDIGIEVYIIQARGAYKSTHNVPPETIERMKKNWEDLTLMQMKEYQIVQYTIQ